jgi:DHA1 family L-arabinose/isopropyl-beta-D-thiogalactopyranoside export protein-like MFS transporter
MGRLLIVMLGAFVAQTAEYLPIGLLPQIGRNLGVPESAVGALVTGYAWIAAVTAVPLTLTTSRLDRRWLFLGLLGVISLANILAALSPDYAMLALMRVVAALTHGVFWSILASLATRIAPEMPAGRALAWAFGGISLAIVAGVPSATAIGQWAGWRAAFSAFALLGFATTAFGAWRLPALKAKVLEAGAWPLGNGRLIVAVIITGLIVAAHFCGYTYIVPLLGGVAGVASASIPMLLFLFGGAGAAGTALAGWINCRPAILALLAAIGIVAGEALMALAPPFPLFAWLEMLVWGASVSVLVVGLQGWVLELAPEQSDTASALYVAMFNLGIGTGAMAGGAVLQMAGERPVLWTGITVGAGACVGLTIQISRALTAKVPG